MDEKIKHSRQEPVRAASPAHLRPAASTEGSFWGSIPAVARAGYLRHTAGERTGDLGWLPGLLLTGAMGLLAEALAMRLAPQEANGPLASALFWLGVILLVLPVALRQAMPEVSRGERIALLAWLGLGLYMIKVLRSPALFVFHDEFAHWRTANNILETARLFGVTSIQEISAIYPGMEIMTAALASASGLSVFTAGVLVVGAARLIAMLAFFLLYEQISGSPRIAALATVMGIAYPNFLFWSSQFGYESVALPLAALLLYAALASTTRQDQRNGLRVVAVLLLGAVVITHHVTSYALTALLIGVALAAGFKTQLLAAIAWVLDRLIALGERLARAASGRLRPAAIGRRLAALPRMLHRNVDEAPDAYQPQGVREVVLWSSLAVLATVGALGWSLIVGQEVVTYIGPHLRNATEGAIGLISGQQEAKTLFKAAAPALATPTWERLLGLIYVVIVTVGLPFGLLQLYHRFRRHTVALVMGLATLTFPFTLLLRVARGGTEISSRSWDFLFPAIGLVLALGLATTQPVFRHRRAAAWTGVAIYATLIFMGAVIVGMPPWARLPGPYLVGGDTRGVQEESLSAATWLRDHAGPDNRLIADYTNKLLLGSYGEQYVVDGSSWLYFSPYWRDDVELQAVDERRIEYIVVDKRVSDELPRTGIYYESGEPRSHEHFEPMDPKMLAKFDDVACFSRVFDSGSIIVYAAGPGCAKVAQAARPGNAP